MSVTYSLRTIATGLLFAVLFLGLPGSVGAIGYGKNPAIFFDQITTNSNRFRVGESLQMSASAHSAWPITKVEVKLDGVVVQQCSNLPCTTTVGPFSSVFVGSHKYSFRITNAVGNIIEPWGRIKVVGYVSPLVVPTPVITQVQTGGNKLSVGQIFSMTAFVKEAYNTTKITIRIDGGLFAKCMGETSCQTSAGPYLHPGEHTYTVVAENSLQTQTSTWGKFWVK